MNKYETKMDKITTEFAEHICDNLCRYPHMADGKSLEIICSDCKIGKFICDILNEYNRINDLDKTQSANDGGGVNERTRENFGRDRKREKQL